MISRREVTLRSTRSLERDRREVKSGLQKWGTGRQLECRGATPKAVGSDVGAAYKGTVQRRNRESMPPPRRWQWLPKPLPAQSPALPERPRAQVPPVDSSYSLDLLAPPAVGWSQEVGEAAGKVPGRYGGGDQGGARVKLGQARQAGRQAGQRPRAGSVGQWRAARACVMGTETEAALTVRDTPFWKGLGIERPSLCATAAMAAAIRVGQTRAGGGISSRWRAEKFDGEAGGGGSGRAAGGQHWGGGWAGRGGARVQPKAVRHMVTSRLGFFNTSNALVKIFGNLWPFLRPAQARGVAAKGFDGGTAQTPSLIAVIGL
ncbi:hypothetical protein GGX14DRAFT_409164 [Mycena pura]|uniref:Uncharacterized protein n=1 Tax=Mycena pura TaxID=153505 RepID=A0AAD6Y0L7_9AGAR|nr:hypothetical protein GGX14DRAFT_409164 [Mycena pura]